MNSKDIKVLEKMLEHCGSIIKYNANLSLEQFEQDHMRMEAIVFNLMQIGEIAKNLLSDEAKEKVPSIPWKQIYGLRNRIVHGYEGINNKVVYDTICIDIPKLNEELKSLLDNN